MRPNKTKEILAGGGIALGSYAFLKDPASVEAMGHAGLDFAVIDMEHTSLDLGDVQNAIRGADATGLTPMVRVADYNEKVILRVLEAGAQGIVLPSVGEPSLVDRALRACRYPPEGTRGTCKVARAAGYGQASVDWESHIRQADEGILSVGLIEDSVGVENVEELVEILDAVVVGRADLASSLGVPGEVDHPRVLAAADRVAEAAAKRGKPIGALCYGVEDALDWLNKGYRLIHYSLDVRILYQAYASWQAQIRSVTVGAAGRR